MSLRENAGNYIELLAIDDRYTNISIVRVLSHSPLSPLRLPLSQVGYLSPVGLQDQ